MTDSANPAYVSFIEQKHKHFDLLCRNLRLTVGLQEIANGYAIVSAAASNVRVFFHHERGLSAFSVGAFYDAKPLCGAEELASRFPRIRMLPEGHQRLDLDEQRHFIESQWSNLQVMFSADHIAETKAWHKAAAAADMKGFLQRK